MQWLPECTLVDVMGDCLRHHSCGPARIECRVGEWPEFCAARAQLPGMKDSGVPVFPFDILGSERAQAAHSYL